MEGRTNLLGLVAKEREWIDGASSDEKNLELRLGPPGVEDWANGEDGPKNKPREIGNRESLLSLGGYLKASQQNAWVISSNNGGSLKCSTPENTNGSFLQYGPSPPSLTVTGKGSSQPCDVRMVDLQQSAEEKTYSPPSATTALPAISSQKRMAPGPVVGWPPIRSFRKNLASSSSSNGKQLQESQKLASPKAADDKKVDNCQTCLFVKINMEGVPIGRKVDLKAFDSYEKLSAAVDQLFRGLLAAQKDTSVGGNNGGQHVEKPITGLLDGSGEFTLVYEDNEGDRLLVGDVPWHMFVSAVKRLRVLKSSELCARVHSKTRLLLNTSSNPSENGKSLRPGSEKEKISV